MTAKAKQNKANLTPKFNQKHSKSTAGVGTPLDRPMGYPPPFRKKMSLKKQHNKKRAGFPQGRFILAEKVANMAPSWAPKSIKNR